MGFIDKTGRHKACPYVGRLRAMKRAPDAVCAKPLEILVELREKAAGVNPQQIPVFLPEQVGNHVAQHHQVIQIVRLARDFSKADSHVLGAGQRWGTNVFSMFRMHQLLSFPGRGRTTAGLAKLPNPRKSSAPPPDINTERAQKKRAQVYFQYLHPP